MRIEEQNQYSLGLPKSDRSLHTDDALLEAQDLLHALLDMSYRCSQDCLETEVNGQRETVSSLYRRCREISEQIASGKEKTAFLAMSILEHTWTLAKPLLLCSLTDMLTDDGPRLLRKARRLERILAYNPYKKIWQERSALYRGILRNAGFDVSDDDFSDLTGILHPLLDALTFYQKSKNGRVPDIYRVRKGDPAITADPFILDTITLFSSEKQLVDAVMSSGKEAMLAFGAVEKTNGQVKDRFLEWYNGFPEERQRNLMRSKNITVEEYLSLPCDYTRKVYLCARSGECCYLVNLPWKGDYYAMKGSNENAYYYGQRASYAPWQIFWKIRPESKDTNLPDIPKTTWKLNELLDKPSQAWLPAFLNETVRCLFGTDPQQKEYKDITFQDILLPEEAVARMPKQYRQKDGYDIIPVSSGIPDACSYVYDIPSPDDLSYETWLLSLMDRFRVTAEDIRYVPVLPYEPDSRHAFDELTANRIEKAYVRILAGRIADYLKTAIPETHRWLLARMDDFGWDIIGQAGSGAFSGFMEIILDKEPVLDENGQPVLTTQDRYPYKEIPLVQKTERNDARQFVDPRKYIHNTVLWASARTEKKPDVIWKIRPCTPDDYAALCAMEKRDLPELLQESDLLRRFYDTYKERLPYSLTNTYAPLDLYGRSDEKSIFLPILMPINICMNKKTHRSFYPKKKDKK